MEFNTDLVFDIDKIASFVFANPNDRTSEVEITESYEYDKDGKKMIPSTRQVKEVKLNPQLQSDPKLLLFSKLANLDAGRPQHPHQNLSGCRRAHALAIRNR